jgi:hypothetical protein
MSRVDFMTGVAVMLIGVGLPRSAEAHDVDDLIRGPAWPDVFIKWPGLVYERPVVGEGDKPEVYRQKAVVDQIGGFCRHYYFTLARDPTFKTRYSAEVLKKEKNPPRELEINQKKAWYWRFQQNDAENLTDRLVVLLDSDKVIIIERFTDGPTDNAKGLREGMEGLAKQFDFARVAKALADPPAR